MKIHIKAISNHAIFRFFQRFNKKLYEKIRNKFTAKNSYYPNDKQFASIVRGKERFFNDMLRKIKKEPVFLMSSNLANKNKGILFLRVGKIVICVSNKRKTILTFITYKKDHYSSEQEIEQLVI